MKRKKDSTRKPHKPPEEAEFLGIKFTILIMANKRPSICAILPCGGMIIFPTTGKGMLHDLVKWHDKATEYIKWRNKNGKKRLHP